MLHEKTAIPVILGDKEDLMKQAKEAGHTIEWNRLEVINPHTDSRLKAYAKTYFEMRKGAITEKAALEEMENNINTFGTMLVEMGEVDGMISGTTFPTSDTVRPALRIIKTKEKFHKVSGFFFMILEKRILLFADCAILEDPNSNELADIAIDTAETARRFGIEPRVAMLSFSTAGSGGSHPFVKKVQEATKMVKYKRPDLIVEGEMQVDAALIPAVCRRKFPQIKTPGDFNVLIFPDLQSGNISYKLVQRLAGADAIGPILQGLNKPVNDLSRGCSAEDIANLAAFTTIEAQGVEKYLE
ncbi:MAG: phosphotransacetylase, phosphate acetyltransferase [Candidatus Peregrinibacteria bacterium GW2011_GWE2_39_6]|nr:MAG: phosphotransacetylase, phosphate acetyltransferase [Candidatus Peregrinibacteria bacterium GW2011_GWE2_39_6]